MILEIVNGIFVISAGTIATILWTIVLSTRMGYKFREKPFERLFLVIAELVMSTIAIISGVALLFQKDWGLPLLFLALGLILYALINAIGVYSEKKYKILVVIIIGSTIITISLIIISLVVLVF